jgi:hypothetical protein
VTPASAPAERNEWSARCGGCGAVGNAEGGVHLVERMSRRTFATFNDLEAAKDWLVEQ